MKGLFQRTVRSAAAWSFLATLLRLGASVFVLPLILRKIPSEQLGLWYVFGTIGGFASLLDFGFEPTITRMASYAWGGASRLVAFGMHKDESARTDAEPNRLLLSDLVATLRVYYFWIGLGVLVLLALGGGGWVWITTANLATATSLRLAWLVYATGCCLNFISGRWPALLTGVGGVREAQHLGVISLLCYYLVAVGGLLAGLGLWAMVLGFLAMGFAARTLGKHAFQRAALPGALPPARFHREIFSVIWPNAWRMGLVSVGAFLVVQANTLVCSAFLGLKTTASYGISFQLISILVGLCGVWVSVKMPLINQLRVQGRNNEIVRVFVSRMQLTVLSYFAGALAILFLAPLVLRAIGSKTTLLPSGQLAVLALIQFLEMHHALYATLVLSENRNPFLKPALISGVAVIVFSVVLTPRCGVWGMLISTGLVQASYNNWWPILRALRGLDLKPSYYFIHIFLRSRPWNKV
jgi:O-antigen/teichoic acid export membrane protein